jgi:hypothetical protein
VGGCSLAEESDNNAEITLGSVVALSMSVPCYVYCTIMGSSRGCWDVSACYEQTNLFVEIVGAWDIL